MTRKLKYWQDKQPKSKETVVAEEHHHDEGPRDPDKLYFEHFDVNKKGAPRKHNGVYVSRYCCGSTGSFLKCILR